jgi:DNA polymerase V
VSAGVVGFESPAAEHKQLELSLDELLVEHPSSTFLALAQGDSMQGVGIFSGDVLIVDRALTAKDHDIIIANLNGELVCKTLDIKGRRLLSANESMKPVRIDEQDSFAIEGVLASSIRLHRVSTMFSG